MTTYSDPTPKATPTNTDNAVIRCSGTLSCDCGLRIKALNFALDKVYDGETGEPLGLKCVKLICPHCRCDLLEVVAL
jgi:hypothetical protein